MRFAISIGSVPFDSIRFDNQAPMESQNAYAILYSPVPYPLLWTGMAVFSNWKSREEKDFSGVSYQSTNTRRIPTSLLENANNINVETASLASTDITSDTSSSTDSQDHIHKRVPLPYQMLDVFANKPAEQRKISFETSTK
mmetsp:Transcript_2037/g.2285  ORF Transcript_2037/g.2285 Transcript_2037/m.2285 type:complete len:141 (+) Transcript_2037:932-1354(+)